MNRLFLKTVVPVALAIAVFFCTGNNVLAQKKDTVSAKDVGWPRQISKDGSTLVYYQPQIDSWKDYKRVYTRMAFALTPQGGKQTLGVANLSAKTDVNKGNRTVYLHSISIDDVRFPALSEDSAKLMEKLLKKLVPTKSAQPISLDRVLADMEKDSVTVSGVELRNDPPKIFYSSTPAILMMVFGDPVYAPIEKTSIKFVINTNWDLFLDTTTRQYYLLDNTTWLTSNKLESGWKITTKLPKDMSKLPAGQNFDDVKQQVPPPPSKIDPTVFYSNQPAELILTDGQPIYSKIDNTNLMYVTNTDNDLFLDNTSEKYFLLVSGRWFSASSLPGPWVYAGNSLPEDFKKIPANSPKGIVLSSVPGTQEAADAVMLAQIPTTAVINKKDVEAKVKVTYDGNTPQFKPIDSTSLEYATNTQEKVIKVGDLYYLCFQGVWFISAAASGPWKVADSVDSKIYTIPPSSPVYNVTYVTQTNATEETVESSTTAGYFGMFVIGMTMGACMAYGTGWYYPPYMYYPPYGYPIYRPYPYSYGCGVAYNPWTGGYAAHRSVYGPYGAAGGSAWYNPSTGRYGRSATVATPYGSRTAAAAYNPWTGGYGRTSQGSNAYGNWGQSAAVRGDDWARTAHVSNANGTTAGYRTSNGNQGIIHSGDNGTVARTNNGTYAGKDGNVYRKNSDGSWSQYNKDGGWSSVNKPSQGNLSGATRNQTPTAGTRDQNLGGATRNQTPTAGTRDQNLGSQNRASVNDRTMGELNNSAQSRSRGQTQTQRYNNYQRSGGGGGGFRGGGGGGGGFRGRR